MIIVVKTGPANNKTIVPETDYDMSWSWDAANNGCGLRYDDSSKQFTAPLSKLAALINKVPRICIYFHEGKCPRKDVWVEVRAR